MAIVNTINFLPPAFRSVTNERFLGATLDQLTTDAINIPLNGYIGRTFAPMYKLTDNYTSEPTLLRSRYQLEPSVVIKDKNDDVVLNSTYIDLLQSIANNGGNTANAQRLFESEYYNYDGHFDYDKFVNYNNYYWMPDGPESVAVTSSDTPYLADYAVTRDTAIGGYTFSGFGGHSNTQLTLARGGTYKFIVDQPGFRFWIQSEPGVSGKDANIPTVSTRQVFGVTNNGTDKGVITFNVPANNAQNFYTSMPIIATVNAAVSFNYTDIQGKLLSEFLVNFPDGLDGITNQLQNKTFVFINNAVDDSLWGTPVVPKDQRHNVWRINLVPDGAGDYVIQLLSEVTISPLQKVFVGSGKTYASTQFWLNNNFRYLLVPPITAVSDYLYYQDSSNPDFVGQIKLVDNTATPINITSDIIGKKSYTSPNGVVFTNGLKVEFDSLVVPESYTGKKFYVDGVGTSIALIPVDQLVVPEEWANGLTAPDYITINRASQDLNPWSRSNRWFHVDALAATAKYNNTSINYGPNIPGRRAIIEFDANMKLFNFSTQAKSNIDLITFNATDAFVDIEGQVTYTLDGTVMTQGMRVVFANDNDPNVRGKIWQVDYELINAQNFLRLIETVDDPIIAGQGVLGTQGTSAGIGYWYDGVNWHPSQVKSGTNVTPYFDLLDANGYSFGDTTVYPESTFTGTKFFGYAVNQLSTVNDTILGFPLTYQNFNNIGDIVFSNFYDTDTFTYMTDSASGSTATIACNSGYAAITSGLSAPTKVNNWVKGAEHSKQYQVITKIHDGYVVEINGVSHGFVQIDVLPDASTTIPYIKVYLNNKILTKQVDYEIVNYGVYYLVALTTVPEIGDKIDVAIFSSGISTFGHYEIPTNLDFNPLNENFSTITLGQLRTHYNKLIENTTNGSTLVATQDRYLKAQGGTILQHSCPAIYGMTFLTDPVVNFVNSIDLARKEYVRFKNKFITLSSSINTLDHNNPVSSVDAILSRINGIKNSSFPWYYSDMIPQGEGYNEIVYTVVNARQTQYEINSIFDKSKLSNRAIIIYLNGSQLTHGEDYTFSSISPTVLFTVSLTVNDKIAIRDYSDTDGNFIPETPTKLGLYPKFTPAVYVDNTYQTPTRVIRGHDGSITPAFGDFRDDFLLELELRIYNNIKAEYANNEINLYDTMPGYFRSTSYSADEWTQLLTQNFLQWVGTNSVDYAYNKWADLTNPWTWNYEQFKDINDNYLQGSWRAIYQYWYETDTPHLTPWNMLGFGAKPTWWESRYGTAPYTSGNTVLWEDLEAGYIYNAGSPYYDLRFARPKLTSIIPVDNAGNLLDPTKVGIIGQYNTSTISNSYKVGSQGPAETAWRRSSDYPYAIQQALALARPAQYFATQIDTSRFKVNSVTSQFSNADNIKISPTELTVNGDKTTVPGQILRTSGYLNWIADYLQNLGIDPVAKIESYFSKFSVQLAYRIAGFTDKKLLTVSAEQTSPGSTNASIIIPDDNYHVYTGKPIPVTSLVYSGVVITKTDAGYSVSGYDLTNPFFTILPSTASGNAATITVNSLSAKVYQDGSTTPITVPYGTNFATAQQVVDFMISYQRYLIALGFVFDVFDSDLQEVRNWILSVKEFLFWAQQGWAPGTIIVLNPVADSIKINTANTVVDEITNAYNGSKLLDINFNPIKSNSFNILRRDSPINNNLFELSIVDGLSTIAFVQLNLIQFENTLIFDNVDDFGDIIYVPQQGTRQYRLKLTGAKTGGWDGAMSAAGYIYSNPKIKNWQSGNDYKQGDIVVYNNSYYTAPADVPASQNFALSNWTHIDSKDIQTGLLPSFGHNAQVFQNIYDVDQPPQDKNYQVFGAGLIGFRERPFLSNLGMSIPTQTKFYQGYIGQKGTTNAIDSLTKATFDNISSTVSTFEEWAFQVGQYGDVAHNQYTEFVLDQSVFLTNPVAFNSTDVFDSANIIVKLNGNAAAGSLGNVYNASDLTSVSTRLYNDRVNDVYSADLPTSGYVHLDDVKYQIFDISTITSMPKVGDGNTMWVAKDFTGSWNVFRITTADTVATKLRYTLDSYAQLTFSNPHTLNVNDYFILQNFNPLFDGMYRVVSVQNALTVSIVVRNKEKLIKTNSSITGEGLLFTLNSSIINDIHDTTSITPITGWRDGDKVWVNRATNNGWGVYEFNSPWLSNTSVNVSANTITANARFGAASAISTDEKWLYISKPGAKAVSVYANVGFEYSSVTTISNVDAGFGSSLDTKGNVLVVGAPTAGKVHVYSNTDGTYTSVQTIAGSSSNKFGTSVSMSEDGHWLFVGEPGDSKVYAYWTANVTGNIHFTSVTNSVGPTGSDFGSVIKTVGNVVYVGAPSAANVNIGNGEVYVYQLGVTDPNVMTLSDTLSSQYKNNYAGFGSSLAVDSTGGNLFVGIPGSTIAGFQNGLVERFINVSTTANVHYQYHSNIAHPSETYGAFGSSMSITNDGQILAVGSAGSAAEADTTFDQNTTLIDEGSTEFKEYVFNSGAVYLFEPIIDVTDVTDIGDYAFVQNLPEVVASGDNFGSSVVATRDVILVGASGTSNNIGTAFIYSNKNKATTWQLIREQQAKVDITSINRSFLYNKSDNVILAAIDYIDPIKGKVLNTVGVDIDYQLAADPARYNKGTGHTIEDFHWGPLQVGKIWWNLSNVRYIDYEQGDLNYRMNNWGSMFPGSTISVYEWVKSPVPPSQYAAMVGDGTPLYPDDSSYSTYGYVTPSGNVNLSYYFWVQGKTTINTTAGKSNSAYSIAAAIENPQAQGVPYATVLRNDAITLYNVNSMLTGKNSVLHLGARSATAALVHREYALVQEGNPLSKIPAVLERKLIDSLAGQDVVGNVVPDATLSNAQKYGIQVRPRQTMFANRALALTNYLTYVNEIMLSYPVVERKLMTTLNSQEPIPNPDSGTYNITVNSFAELGYIDTALISNGYAALVLSDVNNMGKWAIYTWGSPTTASWNLTTVQSYKTSLYWSYTNWYDSGYDSTVAPDVIVANNLEFGKLVLTSNTYVKILDNGSGQFVIYYIDSTLTKTLVGIGNGTLQISTGTIPALEMRQIALAIQQDIFIDDLATQYNHLFFVMIKYALTEQKNLDWVFKTSFMSATQYLRTLTQFPSYIADNQQYYLDYINEVKPYRTTVRQFVVDYQGNDQYNGDTTDFDLPPYWDAASNIYRSPNGEQETDTALLSSSTYSQWHSNYKYQVVDVIIEHAGSGYLSAPQISFTGGGGSGATGYATLTGSKGIASIIITNPGTGYTTRPNIVINGSGTGAVAYAVLRNVFDGNNTGHNLVRSIQTTIKFDRVNYTNSNTFVFWDNITSANVGDVIPADTIIVNNNQLFVLGSDYTVNSQIDFPIESVSTISAGDFDNANDRIIAFNGNIDLALTQPGIDYPGVIIEGNTFVSTEFDSNVQSFYSSVFGVNPTDVIIDGGAYVSTFASHAPEELVPGRMFDSLNMTVYDTSEVAFREFQSMTGNVQFYRIANVAIVGLNSNLNLTDTTIDVTDATALFLPDIPNNTPGVVFINGEKITYWRNYGLETPTAWEANASIATHTLISNDGNLYVTVGNVFAADFANVVSNVQQVTANMLGQIRRSADGTYAPAVHLADSIVVDSSLRQMVPDSYLTVTNIGITSQTYTTTSSVTYQVTLDTAVTANIGDYLTQEFANTTVAANVQIMGNVTNSKVLPVSFVTGEMTLLANTVSINGTRVSGAQVLGNRVLGTVNSAGEVTLPANTNVFTSNIWTSTNSSLDASTTVQATFLKDSLGFTPAAGVTP